MEKPSNCFYLEHNGKGSSSSIVRTDRSLISPHEIVSRFSFRCHERHNWPLLLSEDQVQVTVDNSPNAKLTGKDFTGQRPLEIRRAKLRFHISVTVRCDLNEGGM